MSAVELSLAQRYAQQLTSILTGTDKTTPHPNENQWLPPSRGSLAEGNVIAFDQSLAACGMVLLTFHSGTLEIADARVFKTESQPSNHEGNLFRATDLARQLRSYLSKASLSTSEWTFVHEAPLTGGGRVRNTESSLLAAQAIRIEMDYRGFLVAPMISAQQHKWATSGDRFIGKIAHRTALHHLAELLGVTNYGQITNEALRDAFSIAITQLIRTARNAQT